MVLSYQVASFKFATSAALPLWAHCHVASLPNWNEIFPRREEGGGEKNAQCARGGTAELELEPGTYRMLDESPQLHATVIV